MQKYKLTKAIRFKAEPNNAAPLFEKEAEKRQKAADEYAIFLDGKEIHETFDNFKELMDKAYQVINDFEKLVFEEYENDKGETVQRLRAAVTVHFRWLRQYTQFEWYEKKEQKEEAQARKKDPNEAAPDPNLRPVNKDEKRLPLSDIFYLKGLFIDLCNDWRGTLVALERAVNQPKENRSRRAEIALLLNQFAKRSVLRCLKDFLYDANDKSSEQRVSKLRASLEEFEQLLTTAQLAHLPAQRKGVQLARATFNFYTLDRKGNQYKEELKKIKNEEEAAYSPTNTETLKNLTANAVASFEREIKQTRNEIGEATQKIEEAKIDGRHEKAEKLTINKRRLLTEKLPDLEYKLQLLKANGFKGLNVAQLYDLLKTYKAQEKMAFMEALASPTKMELKDSMELFPLFVPSATSETRWNKATNQKETTTKTAQDNYDRLQFVTFEAEKEAQSYNRKIQDGLDKEEPLLKEQKKAIKKLRQERSAFFQSTVFETYNKICDIYKEVAKKRGEYKARKKGAERAHLDAERLQYWAMLAATKNPKGKNAYRLVLIPKDKAEEAYKKIESLKESDVLDYHAEAMLYYFESFTFRSLQKMTFGIDGRLKSELKAEMRDYIGRKYPKEKDFSKNSLDAKVLKDVEVKQFNKSISKPTEHIDQAQTEANQVDFFKAVLRTNYSKTQLRFASDIADLADEKAVYKNFREFETALEQHCYQQNWLLASGMLPTLQKEYNAQIFDLNNLDLRREEKQNLKEHTKIWDNFWSFSNTSQGFDVRLNPEIAIFWREANAERVAKYGSVGTMKNRYTRPQYTIAFTVSENALSPSLNYAFARFDKQKEALIDFNKTVNDELKKGLKPDSTKKLASFGIDTGEAELATLGLTDDGKPFEIKVLQLKAEKLKFQKTGFFKDGKEREKPYKVIENMSYFLNEALYIRTFSNKHHQATKQDFENTKKDLFEEIKTSTLDLTCAKVICGEIVLNGDIKTRQRLNQLNAQRKIWEELKHDPKSENIRFDSQQGKIFVPERREDKLKEGKTELAIYHNSPAINAARSFQKVEEDLRAYIAKVKSNPAEVLDNINDCRRALAANMVGVIANLSKRFPLVIAIENLDAGSIEKHRLNYEGTMDRPLEHALYRKFQIDGYTPPLSNLVALRKVAHDNQTFSDRLEKAKKQADDAQKAIKEAKNNVKSATDKIAASAKVTEAEKIAADLKSLVNTLSQEEAKQSQYGIMRFVNEELTSKLCPSCRKNAYEGEKERYEKEKKASVFHCKHCGWHNKNNPKGIKNLHSNDAVAAYNIAMRGRIFKKE